MFTLSAIILTVNLWLDQTSSLTHAVLSPVRFADGSLLRCSSCAVDIAWSPKACWSFPCVVVALSPRWHTYHWVVFHASISMTRFTNMSDTSSTYSTLRHCKSCHYKWGWRKDQGQRLSVLACCSIANTATKKINLNILLLELVCSSFPNLWEESVDSSS